MAEDQSAVISFLQAPSTHGGAAVERIDTHASIVFLAGSRAWKLKRAVRYDYLDYSTADRRRAMCERELAVNRRTAPVLYRRVVAITREADGALALGGAGVAVDWVLEMARFDAAGLFDRLAAGDALPLDVMQPLASSVAALHAGAERRFDHGGRAGMAWVINGNAVAFASAPAIFDAAAVNGVTRDSLAELERHAPQLDARRAAGFVRQCHGDLHLRNIVLLDGIPTLFDAIEFNDEIACIDVVYDLAFLLMDLWRRGLRQHANVVLNRYFHETGDLDALRLLPLFLSCRAAVRAKTSASAAALADAGERAQALERAAREHLATAAALLRPGSPVLVAIGGFSGSGKSSVGRALAPALGAAPGAMVLRSDEIRKQLCQVEPLTPLGSSAYAPPMSTQVYTTMMGRAARILAAGHSAIVDAVFARPDDRVAVEQLAAAARVPFVGLWLDAPLPVLLARVQQRSGDPSDADAMVVRAQVAAGANRVTWRRVDATGDLAAVVSAAQISVDDAVHSCAFGSGSQ
jgi:uncharacterized protein